MDQRTPPTVGILASLAVVAVVAAPYVLLSPQAAAGVPTYYDGGLAGPWGPALLSTVALIAFAGGRQRRTPPDTAAGATLVVCVAATLLAAGWALTVEPSVVRQLSAAGWLSLHRFLLVGAAAVATLAAVGWALVLDLL